MQLKCSISLD